MSPVLMPRPHMPQGSSSTSASIPLHPLLGGGPGAPAFWQQFLAWTAQSPAFAQLATHTMGEHAKLWQEWIERQQSVVGDTSSPQQAGVIPGENSSKQRDAFFAFMRDAHALNARFLQAAADLAEIDTKAKGQLRFFLRQYTDALAPPNFLAMNPEAMRLALETNGDSLRRGVENLLGDIAKGRISTVDETAFGVGRNLAVSPGAVVFENELIQLIQYQALTDQVFARPLLIVPPCINKFYILDLQPENSLVRYAVENGHTVFIVSWRNPTGSLGHLGWDDYIALGPLAAIDAVRRITGQRGINTLGFCVGGTILSTALAVLAARGDRAAISLTLLATLLDFNDAGEIGCFVDDASVASREASLGKGGILSGRELAAVFSALRDNDLIWSYVVSNYLKGARPTAFDILYWNADSTNLPGPMFCWYVRNLYLGNKLREPKALTVCGTQVDLGAIRVPTYIVATREDHIVPWRSAYASTQWLSHRARFVLGASGHIAGIINPAAKNRRSYWDNDKLPADPDRWMAEAVEHPGSWWPDWLAWLSAHAGKRVRAPATLGAKGYAPIEPAPGRYVLDRIE
ncbi:MAG: PHA/PHB synthase family protein [Burkholderiales bacterium]